MLKTELLHPEILHALATNGHGAKILIGDGNFPVSTKTPALCKKVFLNFSPGVLSVTQVLQTLQHSIPIESAITMTPPDGTFQPVHAEFQQMLGNDISLQPSTRFDFYEQASSADTCLAIATGDTRRFANLILVIGVRREATVTTPSNQ